MTEYRFHGGITHTYPGELHPEREGVLMADPDEIIDFGDRLPPADGQWYDMEGNQVLPGSTGEEPAAEQEQEQYGPGTGTEEQGRTYLET